MARPATVRRVHAAVLDLARRGGPAALTMEGIAAAAGVGKQTVYRTWPTIHAVLFDALAAGDPHLHGPEPTTVEEVLAAAVAEISAEPHCTLLRTLAASIQTDERVAEEFRERLHAPQVARIRQVVADAGARDPERATELLLAPIFYRWFMRLPQPEGAELSAHVRHVLATEA